MAGCICDGVDEIYGHCVVMILVLNGKVLGTGLCARGRA